MSETNDCDHCNHALYAGTKCKNCGRVTEQAAIKRDLTPEQPAQQGCMRCNTPKKCALYGCSPLTWPAEQPAQQEPVAWLIAYEVCCGRKNRGSSLKKFDEVWAKCSFVSEDKDAEINASKWRNRKETPLYTSPPASKPWVGLTPEDKVEILRANGEAAVLILAEAKLREKNAQSSKPLTAVQRLTLFIELNRPCVQASGPSEMFDIIVRAIEAAHGITKGGAA